MVNNNTGTVITLLISFQKLQEQRVGTYNTFENGVKSYLDSAPNYDFVSYREVVENVTKYFLEISKEIIKIKNLLIEQEAKEAAKLIELVQTLEEKKLNLTAEHHLARQMVLDSNEAEGHLEKQTERDIKLKLGSLVQEINDNLDEIRYIIADE